MTTEKFNEMLMTQEFVDFQFKFMPLSEIENGRFFFFNGSFFRAEGNNETPLRLAKKLNGETKVIPNTYKVSAVINF